MNLRPLGPQPSALPSYAILRHVQILLYAILSHLSSAYFILLKHTMKISLLFAPLSNKNFSKTGVGVNCNIPSEYKDIIALYTEGTLIKNAINFC